MEEVTIVLPKKLNCGECADVLLWLHSPMLLAINSGITDLARQTKLVPGKIADFIAVNSSCYQYVVTYDESLLLDPQTLLEACDIRLLCCVDCKIRYADENIPTRERSVLTGSTDDTDVTVTLTDPEGVITDYTFSIDDGIIPIITVLSDEDSYDHDDARPYPNLQTTPYISPVITVQITAGANAVHAIVRIIHRLEATYGGVALNTTEILNQYSLISSAGPWTTVSTRNPSSLNPGDMALQIPVEHVDQLDIDVPAGDTLDVWTRLYMELTIGGIVTISEANGEIKINAFN